MTSTPVRTPQSTRLNSAAPIKRFSLADITSAGSDLPNRYGLHAVEGLGKTSLITHAPAPIVIQSRGETGLGTLIRAGQVKETPHLPEAQSWEDVHAQIDMLITEDHPYKTVAFDTINGLERLCHEFVCQRDFGGDWGDRGFGGYMRGYEVSLSEWRLLLNKLDALREAKRVMIFMLAHTKVKTFKNPEGADFDRYAPDMHEKTWGLTHKWLDAVFFGNFETVVKSQQNDAAKKGKASGGSIRMLYTQRTAAYDAKNRLGLPEEIEMGTSSAEAWQNFQTALKSSKKEATANV